MIRLPPRPPLTDTPFPYTPLFRSHGIAAVILPAWRARNVLVVRQRIHLRGQRAVALVENQGRGGRQARLQRPVCLSRGEGKQVLPVAWRRVLLRVRVESRLKRVAQRGGGGDGDEVGFKAVRIPERAGLQEDRKSVV